MRTLITTLFLSFFTCGINLFAQPTFSLSTSTIECGQQTCLQVTADNFNNLLSFQYSMNWDAALLGNARVQSFGLSNLSDANFNLGTPGIARIGWDDATLTGVSVAANAVLFEICYDEIGENTGTADIQFSGNPISVEVVNVQGDIVTPTFNNGAVIVNCDEMETGDGENTDTGNDGTGDDNTDTGNDGTDDGNTDTGNGGTDEGNTDTGNDSNNNELAFTSTTVTANCGEQICLDITTSGFTGISSFQYALNWDATLLGQATVQSFGLPDMDASQFNASTSGILRVGYDDASLQGRSLTDGAVLFQLCFDLGANTTGMSTIRFSDNPIAIEVVDIQGTILAPSFTNGTLTVACDNTGMPVDSTTTPVDTTTTPITPVESLPLGLKFSNDTVNCGNQVCIDVSVQGMTDVTSFRFNTTWDFRLLGNHAIQEENLNNLRFGFIAPGLFWTEWRSPGNQPVTIPDNEIIYSICFDVANDTEGSTEIEFVDVPIPILITSTAGNNLNPNLQTGNVLVTCVPEDTDTSDSLAFRMNNVTANCGEQTCLSVTAQDFNNMLSFQYAINYNGGSLGTATIQNFGLPGLSAVNFNTTTPGIVRAGWDDASLEGISVPDDQVLFDICFDVEDNTSGGFEVAFSGNPIAIEAVDIDGNILTPSLQDGALTITCENTTPIDTTTNPVDTTINTSGNLQLVISEGTVSCGEQICLDITSKGFTDILSFQYSINWDAAVLGTATVQQFNLAGLGAGNFNTEVAGLIRTGWTDPNVTGVTMAEDAVLFQICFNAVGNETANSIVQFSGNPLPIEVLDRESNLAEVDLQNGAVNVVCPIVEPPTDTMGMIGDELTFVLSETSGDCANQICMDVSVHNFTDIISYQYSINWDANLLGQASVQSFNMPDLGTGNFNANTPGILRVGWDDTSLAGVEVPDNQVIFQVCFDNIDGAFNSLPINFSGTPTSIEVIDVQSNILTPTFSNGNLTVTCEETDDGGDDGNPNQENLSFELNTVTTNCNTQMCADVRVKGFNDILSFQYSINWDATILGTASVQAFGIPDINTSNFNATTPGVLRVGWDDTFITGVTLPDDHLIFQVCFDATDNSVSNAAISFSDTPIAIEVVDKDGQIVTPAFQNGSITVNCETVVTVDNDGDGFTSDVDCDDNNPIIYPGAMEFPNNNVDEDCDGIALFIDADNDGFNSSIDCDDNNAAINGNAVEVPNNGIDEDCNGEDLVTNVVVLTDNDGDGFMSDVDCDDNNPIIYPGAMEFPNNNVDEDCDGIALFIDADNDGFNSSIDCDDNNAAINGNAVEIPNNGIDEDCNGFDLIQNVATDNDNDGFNSDSDCDDNNPDINPGATEIPNNGIDEDCNGFDLIQNVAIDNDNDGFPSESDCDDNNPDINPGATEIPNNGIDEDCNGADLIQNVATDNDNDGFNSDSDCDDNNPNINPGATEIANNGIDEDCNGADLIQNVATDNDNDGFNSESDCDDNNPNINPGATEIPNNGIDEDCNGADLIESNPDAVTFTLSSETTTCGSQVCLNASVRNFQDLISFQYSLNWDTTILGNVLTQNYNLVGLNNSAFFTPQNGVMRVSWFDTQVAGVSVANDAVIFQICFDVISNTATATTVELSGTPIPIEVIDSGSNEMEVNAVNGEINITNCSNIVSGETTTPTIADNSGHPIAITPQANTYAKVKSNNLINLEIYPNPTNNLLNLKLKEPLQQNGIIKIYSVTGQLLQTTPISKDWLTISLRLGQFSKGVYLLEIQDGDNIERRRVVRQ